MKSKPFDRLVLWFRRDLRVSDNQALVQACNDAREVIPLFVFNDDRMKRSDTGAARIEFMIDALRVLDKNLTKLGGHLIVRRGSGPETVIRFVREVAADGVYFHREYEPFGLRRDEEVINAMAADGRAVSTFDGLMVHEPEEIKTKEGRPYTVFTPYSRNWLSLPVADVLGSPKTLSVPADICGDELSSLESPLPPSKQKFSCGGEDAAIGLLQDFVQEKLNDYGVGRDRVDLAATSLLSPHLHFGTISPRTVLASARGKAGSASFVNELAWREFYLSIIHYFPNVENGAFRERMNTIPWHDEHKHLVAWKNGLTGYPIVDAAMRQLNSEAWMHNRARMITASFLTKDLLINWQEGERYFMQKLVDGDLASNNGGWQWTAGTGTDAQPYFRIFNPVTQGQKFDPNGEYVRKYIPELRRLPANLIHTPWKMTPAEQEYCGVIIGRDYPAPIVDHATQRVKALQMYNNAEK